MNILFLSPDNLLPYLGKTLLISGLLYGYYWCWLRNRPFHQYTRYYLLGIPAISLILPLINFHIRSLSAWEQHSPRFRLLHEMTAGHWNESVIRNTSPHTWQEFLNGPALAYGIYLGITALLLGGLIRSFCYIRRISRLYPHEKVEGILVYQTAEPGTPFSFLQKIFWDDRLDRDSIRGKQVFRHEIYHVRQGHTLDILYLAVLRMICWWNPFFHLILKEIKATHEFLADRYAVSHHDRYEYAELLVWQSIGNHHSSLVNSFFHNHLKRRITMLTQLKNNRPGHLSRIMVLPLLFLLFCAFAIRLRKDNNYGIRPPSKTLTVVIDAGHGGFDPGAVINDIQEKDLTLAIAKKIRQLSAAYNVNVLLTRDEDIMPGGKSTKEEGLRYRTSFADEHHADLFISLHINNDDASDTARGFQVYLSQQNVQFRKSSLLGSAMVDVMKDVYPSCTQLIRTTEIYVLRTARMPAVLIECGYLSNPKDRTFISREENQEIIARNILQGIVNYGDQ